MDYFTLILLLSLLLQIYFIYFNFNITFLFKVQSTNFLTNLSNINNYESKCPCFNLELTLWTMVAHTLKLKPFFCNLFSNFIPFFYPIQKWSYKNIWYLLFCLTQIIFTGSILLLCIEKKSVKWSKVNKQRYCLILEDGPNVSSTEARC